MIRCSNYKNASIGLYELGFVEAVNLLVGLIRSILMKVSNKKEMKMLLILTFSGLIQVVSHCERKDFMFL